VALLGAAARRPRHCRRVQLELLHELPVLRRKIVVVSRERRVARPRRRSMQQPNGSAAQTGVSWGDFRAKLTVVWVVDFFGKMSSRIASLTRAQVNALAIALLERNDAAREFGLHFMYRFESNVWSPSRLVSVPAATAASRVKVTLRWRPPDALDLTAMRLEDESAPTDITITCGVRTFHAHRALLVQGSDFFRGMFSSGMAEGGGAVALQGADHTLLEYALTFFYSSACTLRQDGLLDLLQMSVRLQMHDLSSAVVGAAGNRLHAGNWIGALNLAGELGLPELASLARKFAVSTYDMMFGLTRATPLPYLVWSSTTIATQILVHTAPSPWQRATRSPLPALTGTSCSYSRWAAIVASVSRRHGRFWTSGGRVWEAGCTRERAFTAAANALEDVTRTC